MATPLWLTFIWESSPDFQQEIPNEEYSATPFLQPSKNPAKIVLIDLEGWPLGREEIHLLGNYMNGKVSGEEGEGAFLSEFGHVHVYFK